MPDERTRLAVDMRRPHGWRRSPGYISEYRPRGEMPVREQDEPPVPVEGVDYYVENGRWVFTAAFHLKRGFCCGSGCRHCPYRDRQPKSEAPCENEGN